MSDDRTRVTLDRIFERGLTLLGATTGSITFDVATPRRKKLLTFTNVPRATKFVSVGINAIQLYFNTVDHPRKGELGGFIVDCFKKSLDEIEQDAAQRGEFELDVSALLEGVGNQKDWSGVVWFDILCFG